jgi:hypothetical protein
MIYLAADFRETPRIKILYMQKSAQTCGDHFFARRRGNKDAFEK